MKNHISKVQTIPNCEIMTLIVLVEFQGDRERIIKNFHVEVHQEFHEDSHIKISDDFKTRTHDTLIVMVEFQGDRENTNSGCSLVVTGETRWTLNCSGKSALRHIFHPTNRFQNIRTFLSEFWRHFYAYVFSACTAEKCGALRKTRDDLCICFSTASLDVSGKLYFSLHFQIWGKLLYTVWAGRFLNSNYNRNYPINQLDMLKTLALFQKCSFPSSGIARLL